MRLIAPALALLAGALASRLLMRLAPASIAVDLAQPLPVATNWHGFGIATWVLLTCTLALVTLAYVAILRDLRRGASSPWPILGAAALALVAGFWFAPVFSSDVYAYAAYGKMANAGIDPYARVLLPKTNALFAAAMWQWGNPLPICAYGPAFVSIARISDAVVQSLGVPAQLGALRLLSCIALLVAGLFAYYAGDEQGAARRAATLVLNPVALWSAIEGHNDTLMVACALAGMVVYRRSAFGGAFGLALAGLIKVPALIASAAFGANALARRRAALPTALGALAGIVVTLIFSGAWLRGITQGTLPHGHYAPQASFQALTFALAGEVGGPLIALAATTVLCVYAWRVWKTDAVTGWAIAAIGAWLLIPNPYPWYGLWLLALVIFTRNPAVRRTILALVWVSLVRYIPDAAQTPEPVWSAALGALASLPVLLLWLPKNSSDIIVRS